MKRFFSTFMALAIAAATLTIAAPATAAEPECTIMGTSRADKLMGTAANDVICAGAGNDLIYGLGGDDIIKAGSGNDQVFAGVGNDTVLGEAGNDVINGSDGADRLEGGAGKDNLSGLGGQDVLLGGSSSDSISGGNASDIIDGGASSDSIRTGAGSDVCSADTTDTRLDACKIDSTGPEFAPMTMEVKQFKAGSVAVFTLKASDASGVVGIYGFIGGAPGWVTEWCGFGIEAELVSGTAKSGTFEIRCEIPEDAVDAEYALFLNASDMMGNASAGPTIAFTVSGGSSDNKTPEVTDVKLPESVKNGEFFQVSVTAKDDSGVQGIYAWFMLDGGGFSDGKIIYASGSEPRAVETSTETVYVQDYVFDPAAPQGTYSLWLSVRDVVGNREFYDSGRKITVTK